MVHIIPTGAVLGAVVYGLDISHPLSEGEFAAVLGALGLMLYLLIACTALSGIPASARAVVLLLAPAVGRLTPLLVGPRVRPATPGQGLGAAFLAALPRAPGPVWLAALLVLAWLLLGLTGAAMTAGALVAGAGGAVVLARRFGGLTGDALGAGVELSELAWLVLGASCAHRNLI
jgi:adenosylcobinamide-GDP ribazoletransferase